MTETRNAILDIAEEIYRTGGADALSMRRIAEARGFTATAIYRHFDGKDELLDAVANRGFERLAAAFRRALRDPGTPREQILRIAEAFRRFALKRPALFDLMFFKQRPEARRFPSDLEAGSSPSANVLVGLLRDLGAQDPVGLALVVWAQAQGLLSLYLAGRFDSARAFKQAWDRSFDLLLETRFPTPRATRRT